MQPHNCRACGLAVTVEKFSTAHTSIQWLSDSAGCPFNAARGQTLAGDSCPELQDSIDDAVREHVLTETRIELPTGSAIPRMSHTSM
ncbi:hypothetical protein [Gordonia terrae]|nr:hypothetical protein [Gordonia terrae]